MMDTVNIIIDLDNTMVMCNVYYQFAKTNLVKYIKKISKLSEDDIASLLEKFELERLNSIDAFSSKTFPDVFEKTLREACPDLKFSATGWELKESQTWRDMSVASNHLESIKMLAKGVFNNAPYSIYPTVNETLLELNNRGYRLWLASKGDFYTQLRKIQDLSKVFNGVFIVPNKNADVYSGIVTTIRGDLKNTWMIGDSPTDDIISASNAGLKTIWVRRSAKSSWIGDPFISNFEYNHSIETFSELLNIFK